MYIKHLGSGTSVSAFVIKKIVSFNTSISCGMGHITYFGLQIILRLFAQLLFTKVLLCILSCVDFFFIIIS